MTSVNNNNNEQKIQEILSRYRQGDKENVDSIVEYTELSIFLKENSDTLTNAQKQRLHEQLKNYNARNITSGARYDKNSNSKIDKSIASEIYYSFASINDQKDNIKDAVTYYKKCILTEQNPQKNKYLSRALANLAELYDEAGKSEQAVKYYIQSLKIDEKSKNYNGIYATSRHLADLYSGKSTQEALHYLEIANLSAQKLKEPYYLSDINYELGNYHLLRKNFEQALKYFDISLEIATNSLSKEDIDKIKAKIDYIKNI